MVRGGIVLTIIIIGGLIMTILKEDSSAHDEKIHQAAVAGSFYPGDSTILSQTVENLLNEAEPPAIDGTIFGLVSPHAGYVYSGHVAAAGYDLLKNKSIERVVVISPSHVVAFDGVAVYNGTGYRTPLGTIPVDEDFCRQLAERHSSITLSDEGHETRRQGRMEHALEVQLPFLQNTLGHFKLVPIIMGDQKYETCRALGIALSELIKDDKTIIVASSDLSHFHPYKEAVKLDQKVLTAVHEWDHINLSRNLNRRIWEACGGGPIVATMIACEKLGADKAQIVKYANSGDVPAGDKSSVVGYMSAVFYKSASTSRQDDFEFSLTKEEQNHLMDIAKRSVRSAVESGQVYECTSGGYTSLEKDRGAFVTLKEKGQLRGCIGYVSAVHPLFETIRGAAISAALKDPRFPPVNKGELKELTYEISVLSPFNRIYNTEQIVVGKHGLMIRKGRNEGLLLPQVASDNNWDRLTFLQQTCRKAGLPPDAWKDEDTDIFVFSAFVFGEEHIK
jgi:AmmeMemoRadiSam system protein B/AmmeMemoRadiSam system protein A